MADTAKNLAPPPYSQALTDQTGRLAGVWNAWMRGLYDRVGQSVAKTNKELETVNTAAADAVQANVNTLSATVTNIQTQVTSLLSRADALEGGLTQGRQL